MRKRKARTPDPVPAPAPAPKARKSPITPHGGLAVVIGLCVAVAAYSVLGRVGSRYWSSCAFGAVALFSALGHLLLFALQRRSDRATQLLTPGTPAPRRMRRGVVACLAGAFAVVPVCLWPVLLVEVLGWPRMKGSEVELVSPGDTVQLWVDGPTPRSDLYRIRSANASVKNPEELGGPAAFPVTIENHPTVPRGGKEKRGEGLSRYLIQTTIPNDPAWGGKIVRAQIHLVLEDADKRGNGWIVSGSAPVEIPVAPEGAPGRYREAW